MSYNDCQWILGVRGIRDVFLFDCVLIGWQVMESCLEYRQISDIRHTKSQILNVSHLVLQLSNPLKPGIKSRMSDQQLNYPPGVRLILDVLRNIDFVCQLVWLKYEYCNINVLLFIRKRTMHRKKLRLYVVTRLLRWTLRTRKLDLRIYDIFALCGWSWMAWLMAMGYIFL